MTSSQESSDRARKPNKPPEIESLAGAFHPHAIEVQDFSHYALVTARVKVVVASFMRPVAA